MIETPRLILRRWRDSDLPIFGALNADPRVMEFFPRLLDRVESDARAARIRHQIESSGFGFWAVEVKNRAEFIGFVGLSTIPFEVPSANPVEIGWRLAFEHWGQGYATEAAGASLDFGFDRLGLSEIVAFTAPANRRSRQVMERLGMTRSPADDFDHPAIPEGHALRRHVLYRIKGPTRTAGPAQDP